MNGLPARSWVLAVLFFLLCPSPGLAHKVIVFGWLEKGRVNLEAGFGSRRPAKNCGFSAFDTEGNLIYQGVTDNEGRQSFDIPDGFHSDLKLVLEAGPGHRGTWTIPADEFSAADRSVPAGASPVSQGVDPLRVVAGIAVIFTLALGARRVRAGKGKDGS